VRETNRLRPGSDLLLHAAELPPGPRWIPQTTIRPRGRAEVTRRDDTTVGVRQLLLTAQILLSSLSPSPALHVHLSIFSHDLRRGTSLLAPRSNALVEATIAGQHGL
jgi:hypothetical protein